MCVTWSCWILKGKDLFQHTRIKVLQTQGTLWGQSQIFIWIWNIALVKSVEMAISQQKWTTKLMLIDSKKNVRFLKICPLSPSCYPSLWHFTGLRYFRIWCICYLRLKKSKDHLFRWGLFLFLMLFILVTHRGKHPRTLLEFKSEEF